MPAIGVLIAWLANLATSAVVRSLVWKAFLYALFCITLPLVLKGVFWAICETMLSNIPSTVSDVVSAYHNGNAIYHMSGLMGWIAARLRLPECLGIYLGALSAKVSLRMMPIPFMRIVR